MNTENKTELYASPEVEVIEINARQVICGSYDGSPANMDWGEDDGANW